MVEYFLALKLSKAVVGVPIIAKKKNHSQTRLRTVLEIIKALGKATANP